MGEFVAPIGEATSSFSSENAVNNSGSRHFSGPHRMWASRGGGEWVAEGWVDSN